MSVVSSVCKSLVWRGHIHAVVDEMSIFHFYEIIILYIYFLFYSFTGINNLLIIINYFYIIINNLYIIINQLFKKIIFLLIILKTNIKLNKNTKIEYFSTKLILLHLH